MVSKLDNNSSEPNNKESNNGNFSLLPKNLINYIITLIIKKSPKTISRMAQLNKNLRDVVYHLPIVINEEEESTYKQLLEQLNDYQKKEDQFATLVNASSKHLDVQQKYEHFFKELEIKCIGLISIGAGCYIGMLFNHIFNNYFIGIENGILASLSSVIGGLFYINSDTSCEVNLAVANKIADFKMGEVDEKAIDQLRDELHETPYLREISGWHNYHR